MATQPDILLDEIARRTGQGWVLVLRDAAEAQMRKPKRFSFLWFLAWTFLSFGTLFWVYLIWHWAKSDQLIYLRMVEGQLVVTSGGRGGVGALFAPFAAYWRWAGQRESTQGKVAAYGGPVAAVIVLIIIISVTSATGGGGDGEGEQVAGQPTEAAAVTGTQEPDDQGTAEPTQPPQPTDLPAYTSAECAYANRVQLWTSGMADSAFEMSDLFLELADNPLLLFDDGWTIQMAAQFVFMRVTYDELSAATPPESMRTIHQKLVESFSKANDATEFLIQGIDNIDPDLLEQGTALFIAASDDLAALPELIGEFAATRSGSC